MRLPICRNIPAVPISHAHFDSDIGIASRQRYFIMVSARLYPFRCLSHIQVYHRFFCLRQRFAGIGILKGYRHMLRHRLRQQQYAIQHGNTASSFYPHARCVRKGSFFRAVYPVLPCRLLRCPQQVTFIVHPKSLMSDTSACFSPVQTVNFTCANSCLNAKSTGAIIPPPHKPHPSLLLSSDPQHPSPSRKNQTP